MTIQEVHNIVYDKLNKDQTGYITHGQIDRALDVGQLYYMKELYGPTEQARLSSTATTQKLHDDLMPFKKTISYNSQSYSSVNAYGTGPGGVLVLPSDYFHFWALYKYTASFESVTTLSIDSIGSSTISTSFEDGKTYRLVITFDIPLPVTVEFSLEYEGTTIYPLTGIPGGETITIYFTPSVPNGTLTYSTNDTGSIAVSAYGSKSSVWPVEMLSEDQVGYRLGSSLLSPSSTEPIALFYKAGGYVNSVDIGTKRAIKFFPEQGFIGDLVYLKRPAQPVFGFTQSGRTITYDSSASTQLEWGDQAIMKIIDKAVNYLGIHLQDTLQLQHTQGKDQLGV